MKRKMIEGIFFGSEKGFGFVRTEESKEDYFIPKNCCESAFHGDRVLIEIVSYRGKGHAEGKVVKILERAVSTVVGSFMKGKNRGYAFVVTDNRFYPDIFIDGDFTKKAKNGDKVVVEITDYGKKGRKPEGKVVEILGKITDPGVDVLSVVRTMGIPEDFESAIFDHIKSIPDKVDSSQIDSSREDYRETLMVTIDGEDAKDLDDAVSLSETETGYVLGVHIADVSHYVKEGDLLDKEALKRGCSVYLVDRVIPMLPVKLSNGICSLNAGVDRLAMSCVMTIDKKGEVIDYKITPSVIKVAERMNYTSVNKIINGDRDEAAKHKNVTPMLLKMKELSLILRKKRKERGSIDFDIPESKITLDKNGRPKEIKPYEANDATRLIEEFMLIANETVASHMFWQELPFLYRVHESPDKDKLESLAIILQGFGYYLKGDKADMHPKEIQKMINEFEGRDEESLVLRLSLRSMKQARYSPECLGHFGLSCKQYSHFTSPIRRYPDLIIHRILKEELGGNLNEKRIEHYNNILEGIASQSSKMERRANEAERMVDKIKKAEYMESRLGQVYEGVISGVTGYGVYVELPNTVEGLVHISKLPGDYFEYDEDKMEIHGTHTDSIYSLGKKMKIVVTAVDMKLYTIDFEPYDEYDEADYDLDKELSDIINKINLEESKKKG